MYNMSLKSQKTQCEKQGKYKSPHPTDGDTDTGGLFSPR